MNKRLIIFICMLLVTLISAYFIPSVNINYDMTQYLPEDSKIKTAMQILEDEFGNHSLVEIQIDDIEPSEVIDLSNSIESIEHIEKVIWLDDYVDLNTVPIAYIDEELLSNFYVEDHALLQVMIDLDAYDLTHESVISDIELELQDYDYALRGDVIRNIENRTIANQETLKIMFLIVPVVIIILIFASSSWIEPIIILISLGFAIIMNMGTNALLKDVSFITQTMSLALQLALSLDYGLLLLH